MSAYSGKCDFYDHVFMSSKLISDEELFEKFRGTKLYKHKKEKECIEVDTSTPERLEETLRKNWEEIHYESIKDLVPYFPYLIGIAACDNTDSRNSTVVLSSESFVDREERESLEFKLKEVLRVYNRCKRKKIEFDIDDCVREVCWFDYSKDIYIELARRVKENGKKATIDGIHLNMQERYRLELVKEMLKYGLNPCDYGDYARFLGKEE